MILAIRAFRATIFAFNASICVSRDAFASVTFGGNPTKAAFSLDKTIYSPGGAAVLTVTLTDSSSNPTWDGAHADALTATSTNAAVQGLTVTTGITTSSGKKTFKFYAPVSGGTFTLTDTAGTGLGTGAAAAVTTSASVTDANAALTTQIDALNAKIVALNALIAKIMKKLGVK